MSALTDGRTGKRPPSGGGKGCISLVLAVLAALVTAVVLVVR